MNLCFLGLGLELYKIHQYVVIMSTKKNTETVSFIEIIKKQKKTY